MIIFTQKTAPTKTELTLKTESTVKYITCMLSIVSAAELGSLSTAQSIFFVKGFSRC